MKSNRRVIKKQEKEEELMTADKLFALATKKRDEMEKNRYLIAQEEAKKDILEDYKTKMLEAAQNGKYYVDLYSWNFVEPSDRKTYRYQGLRVSDILFKEPVDEEKKVIGKPLIEILKEFFNSQNYSIHIYIWKNSPDSKRSIRVSWSLNSEKHLKVKETKKDEINMKKDDDFFIESDEEN
jgi:hypothetical protein